MPKMKTHKGAAKRFKKTGSGKWVRNKSHRIHRHTKSTRTKQGLDKDIVVDKIDENRLKRLLPYS